MNLIRAFLHNESGATAIEYGLIVTFISLVLLSSFKGIGTKINGKFQSLSNGLN